VIGTWRPTASYLGFSSLTAMKDPNKRDALPSSSELAGRHTNLKDNLGLE